jgi:hypothetical protein
MDLLVKLIGLLLETFGPMVLRRHIDEGEAAKAASDAAFRAKFPGEDP